MSVSMRNPPQRRRSLGPVSPKRIYRNLSVRLRGGESSVAVEVHAPKRTSRPAEAYKTLWDAVENEDTLAVQSLLSKDHASCGGGGSSLWERGEKKETDWERDKEKGVNRVSEQGLVPLDVAALTHNSPLLHVLTKAGARHNPILCRPADWGLKLDALVDLASRRMEERKSELARKTGAGPQAQTEVQRQSRLWRLRLQLYCRMRENFQNTGSLFIFLDLKRLHQLHRRGTTSEPELILQAGRQTERLKKDEICWERWASVVIASLLSLVQTGPQRHVE